MLAAVDRLLIADFSLRVEQSEIVEVALRVLAALQSLCSDRKIGRLLETAILLDRALRTRMWDIDYGSIFFQCQGLSDVTKKGLNDRTARTLQDLNNCTQFRIQDLLACSSAEANQILLFTTMCRRWTLDLCVGYGPHIDDSTHEDKGTMKIDVVRVPRNVQSYVPLDMFGHPVPVQQRAVQSSKAR